MGDAGKYVGRGYAPGNYCCICKTCNGQFIGEKRSWCCLGCAKSADRIEQLEAERDAAHKRGLEDAAEIAEGWPTLGAPQGIAAAIRAKIQERDDDN